MSTQETIAHLNDKARKGRLPGSTRMFLTRVVAALPEETLAQIRCAVSQFDAFTEDNDPYGERDFGAVDLEGERYLWKIDYYDRSLQFGAEDPTDPPRASASSPSCTQASTETPSRLLAGLPSFAP